MSGGETPTGRAGSGRGGTLGRAAAMGAMEGIPGEGIHFMSAKHRSPSTELNPCRLLPKPVCGGMASGGCFILGGSEGGRGCPWSFNLMSFMAMENSWISIRPSLFMSARALKVI